jgi:hypothetical protein
VAPETHLLASWIIAAKTTDNPRDCRLVTLSLLYPRALTRSPYFSGASANDSIPFSDLTPT